MPVIIQPHDPRKPKGGGPWARFAKFAAALAVVAGALAAGKTICDIVCGAIPAPAEPQLRVGWLTVNDPKSLECVIKPGNTFKLHKDGALISQAINDCYAQLKKVKDAPLNEPQALGKSYFLYLENTGDPIETLTLYKGTQRSAADKGPSFQSLEKGAPLAICVGYEGRSNLMQSRNDAFGDIEIVRAKSKRTFISIPSREVGSPRGVSDCDQISWNYPD